ncbi:hypothetical protein CC117_20190 [Parafrankia colletiae]|uniref:DUF4352 domain-containing protein n=1 Tax=Parafrankia colletiae TaxID=573497 RepID=A0A1S1QM98_9ACTN|nr:DUF4352 domain-containing protein [Parafrankia colletiae]MCK9904396.1 DUF4352 domain-containing protein [Frankia sp. Cpl3]OHV35100.1 hypothetical protein CC117_20190 [Parafrankia colletiae]
MTDQTPPGHPPPGQDNQETWRAPNSSWQQPPASESPAGGGSATPPPAPAPQWPTPGGAPAPGQQGDGGAWPSTTPAASWGTPPAAGASPESSWPGAGQQPQQQWPQQGADTPWGQQGQQGTGWQQPAGQQGQAGSGWPTPAAPGQQGTGWQQAQGGYPGQYPPQGYPQAPQQGYQQPGYQQGFPEQQPGGWPQPGGTPPGRRRNPAMIIVPLAVVAAIVLGVIIALSVGGGDDTEPTASGSTLNPRAAPTGPVIPGVTTLPGGSVPTQPAGGAQQPGAPEGCVPVTPAGPPPAGVAGVGGAGTVTGNARSSVSDFEAKVTLNSICSSTGRVEEYGDPPSRGAFYVVNVTVEVSRGETSAAPSDFYVQTEDGSRYDGEFTSVEPDLYTSDVKAGQKVTGNVVIDAPAGHHKLNWEPLFAVAPATFQF